MTDYVKATNFAVKDSLPTGDPNKLTRGSEVDAEFILVELASRTKYDSDDLADSGEAAGGSVSNKLMTPLGVSQRISALVATELQAEAGTNNQVLMTPLRVNNVLDDLSLLSGQSPTFGDISANSIETLDVSSFYSIVTDDRADDVGGTLTVVGDATFLKTVTANNLDPDPQFIGNLDGDVITATGNHTLGYDPVSTASGLVVGPVSILNDGSNITCTGNNSSFARLVLGTTTAGNTLDLQCNNVGATKHFFRGYTEHPSTKTEVIGLRAVADSTNVELRRAGAVKVFTIQNDDDSSVVDFTEYPTADGKLFDQTFIRGFSTQTNNPTGVSISSGQCADNSGSEVIVGFGVNTKDFSTPFALGSGNGGFTGVRAADTWYRLFVIRGDAGTLQYGWDDQANASTLLAAATALGGGETYDQYRQIAWNLSGATGNELVEYKQYGDEFIFNENFWEASTNYTVTTRQTANSYTPPDANVFMRGVFYLDNQTSNGDTGTAYLAITNTTQADYLPSISRCTTLFACDNEVTSSQISVPLYLPTPSSEFHHRISAAFFGSTFNRFSYTVEGWVDRRGKL